MKNIIDFVQSVVGLFVAIVGLLSGAIVLWRGSRKRRERSKGTPASTAGPGVLISLVLPLAPIVVGLSILALRFLSEKPTAPTVQITSPLSSVEVTPESTSVFFPVEGTSTGVSTDNTLKLYVLVYWATDWHVQRQAGVGADGRWFLDRAWIGGPGSEVGVGSVLRLAVVVSRQDRPPNDKVSVPQQLAPVARSQEILVKVTAIRSASGQTPTVKSQ